MFKKLAVTLFIVVLLFTLCKKASEIQQEDKKRLDAMYSEIQKLSNSKTCVNSSEWSFTTVGVSSNNIMTYHNSIKDEFLKKVQDYNKADQEYSKKWDINYAVDQQIKPQKIECVDGKAKLIY